MLCKLLALVACGACSAATSKLAPTLTYAGKSDSLYAFLHSYDSLPKVLLLRESAPPPPPPPEGEENGEEAAPAPAAKGGASEPPSWFTSVAVHFKDGRKKSASFAMIEGDDAKKVAARFGVKGELPSSGIVVGCAVDGKSSGSFAIFDGLPLGESSGKVVREVRSWVQTIVDGSMEGETLPAFPPPDVPRKSAALSLIELTHDNLPTHCFGGSKSLCVIAVLPRGTTACPDAFKSLAARHRNDPVQFAWLKSRGQSEFIGAFGLDDAQLPRLVAVRTGKRARFALSEGAALETPAMGAFVDNILGGGASFKKLSELPELTPPYLMDPEDKQEL